MIEDLYWVDELIFVILFFLLWVFGCGCILLLLMCCIDDVCCGDVVSCFIGEVIRVWLF